MHAFEKKIGQLALTLGILLAFKKLQEVNYIFKMAISIGLIEIGI